VLRARIIPVLLVRDGALVKTRAFGKHAYIGDPLNAVRIFNDLRADELVFFDVLATPQRRGISVELVKAIGEEAQMPFAVGGGIRSLSQIHALLSAGAEKVVIGTHAVEEPGFVGEAARHFGSSTIVVCIDVKKTWLGQERAWTMRGTKRSDLDPEAFARLMEQQGAGEVIVQSVERDGAMAGYDLDLLRRISSAVTIPVIALGGAGSLDHMRQAFHEAHASALAAGSLFVFQGQQRGVLINYPDRSERALT